MSEIKKEKLESQQAYSNPILATNRYFDLGQCYDCYKEVPDNEWEMDGLCQCCRGRRSHLFDLGIIKQIEDNPQQAS